MREWFFILIPSHSHVPIPVPAAFPVAAHIYFHSPPTFQIEFSFPHVKIPASITRTLNVSPNQIQCVQTAHYAAQSLNTQYDGLENTVYRTVSGLAIAQNSL